MCIAETEEREYEVTYKKYKSSQECETEKITIVLKDYVESYNEELMHDPKESDLWPYKIDFLKEVIQKTFGEKSFISIDNLYDLMHEVDKDVEEILDEYAGYSNNDDEE
ncbi:hypothetical protein [Pectinatus cerevisiiphilus]|uniref:Uncharacterized protein n=1 Tax=Pectinatus cerevisiiphilus TaxID=86956 RepID=A0A4R3K1Q6_9FIRM|nr:hypothetical protein [Pectinatus cerevisiiphilus]TCS75762.1 hypothetical protein EDC37_12816 [Pectinatus cerevisiiphilus]